MNKPTEVQAVFKAAPALTRRPCHLCGGLTEKSAVLVEVPAWHTSHPGFRVCERCIAAGDLDGRLAENADALVREARDLRGLIGRLKVPTFEQWAQAEQLADAIHGLDLTLQQALAMPAHQQRRILAAHKVRMLGQAPRAVGTNGGAF